MKRQIERIKGLGPGLGQVDWQEQLQLLSKLCEEAAEKFTRAQTAIDDEGDEGDDGMEERDVDWMVLHVEHLLEFVNFAKVALNNCQSLETKTEWLRRALLAWRSALTEILAICHFLVVSFRFCLTINWENSSKAMELNSNHEDI